jgi:general L-amino acid transport system permease protein
MTKPRSTDFVRQSPLAERQPPAFRRGWVRWIRDNLFSSPVSAFWTLLTLYAAYLVAPPLIDFFVTKAVWTGNGREACLAGGPRQEIGACWAFIGAKLGYYVYGSYPLDARWRVDVVFALGIAGVAWMLKPNAPRRGLGAAYFFIGFPVAAFLLLNGSEWLGLSRVATSLWGGILVTLLVALVGIVFSLPLGILLSLGRRSVLPGVRLFCILLIEVVRGVPLITVLFMANTMLPLFLPGSMTPDRLLRPLVGIALFSSAYMAEVVRGGLQAIPRGQYEGAASLGLGYWRSMQLVILPQALRIVIPSIVNTFISLFKDTTLVALVGIFDFLKTIDATLIDPAWATPVTDITAYAFAAGFYFVFCFGMSHYSARMENKLAIERTQ